MSTAMAIRTTTTLRTLTGFVQDSLINQQRRRRYPFH
nr:MAG TPA: hypothetical protein [Caudoviricetes sp.]